MFPIQFLCFPDVFCEEHGSKELNKCICPACDTQLPGKYDVLRVDLQPSEEYKSVRVTC